MSGPSDWPLPAQGVRFFVPAFLRRQLAASPLARGLYPHAMGYYPNAEGHRVERREHDDHLLLYCIDGAGSLATAAGHWRIGAGDLVALPRGIGHRYRASARRPWTLYWVHFGGALGPAFWQALDHRPERPVVALGLSPKVIADFDLLLAARRSGYSRTVFVHAAQHLGQMIAYIAAMRPRMAGGREGAFDVDRVRSLMHERINASLSLQELAERMGMSRYTLARKYKRATGNTPIQDFIHLKMERACQLLDFGRQDVQEVAWALGYDDPYYFSRLFRRVIGVSPSGYRALRHG